MNFLKDWTNCTEYFKILELMAGLSKLFSDSSIPFLHYRITENIFCKYYKAENLSRSDTAYDAKIKNFGIGIKTFQLNNNNSSREKIAEFNSISNFLKQFKGYELAYQLAKARNERIELGKRLYSIDDGCYHIIGRCNNGLKIFNTEYQLIDLDKISSVSDTGKTLSFTDGNGEYTYNYSKSTLFKLFEVKGPEINIPISIIDDPYDLFGKILTAENMIANADKINFVHELIKAKTKTQRQLLLGYDYVILPLFSTRNRENPTVPEKSGINQWNASGRQRDPNEIYIPIPAKINSVFKDFFPDRDVCFSLKLPNGSSISAKPCQENRKALMSNPNKDLGKWLLRDVMQLKEKELVTMDTLNRMGFDSVIVYKDSPTQYRIDVCRTASYSDYLFD